MGLSKTTEKSSWLVSYTVGGSEQNHRRQERLQLMGLYKTTKKSSYLVSCTVGGSEQNHQRRSLRNQAWCWDAAEVAWRPSDAKVGGNGDEGPQQRQKSNAGLVWEKVFV